MIFKPKLIAIASDMMMRVNTPEEFIADWSTPRIIVKIIQDADYTKPLNEQRAAGKIVLE